MVKNIEDAPGYILRIRSIVEGVPAIKINLLINLLNVAGVSIAMRLPAINGVVLEVPSS